MKAQYQKEIGELERELDEKEMELLCMKSHLRHKNAKDDFFAYRNNESSATPPHNNTYNKNRFSFNNSTRFRDSGVPRGMQQSLNTHPENHY